MTGAVRPGRSASVADWLSYQERLHPRTIDLSLERAARVALRLDLIPSQVPTLTVAGTNGKGSSATLASLAFREAGHRVGLYTSPHLLRYQERIVIDGEEIADHALIGAFEAVEQAREEVPLTYFEFGTLAALWCFRSAGVTVQVLEVGLGGRLDATNIVDADVALITPIGLDHTDWLGPDREAIAAEKAGILRPGRPAVCADLDPPTSIARAAQRLGARLWQAGRDFRALDYGPEWTWEGPEQVIEGLPVPGLPGGAQLSNASGVIAALQLMNERVAVDEPALRRALPRLSLPGRCQTHGRYLLDVSHNAEAAEVLASEIARRFPGQSVHLVLGMLSDKPVADYARALAPRVISTHFAGLPPPRGLAAWRLSELAAPAGLSGSLHDDVASALADAETRAPAETPIVVCGSFLTVAAALQVLQ